MTGYLIALEGGGTRSQAALMDLSGRVLQIIEAGDVNTNFTSFEKAQQNVTHAVEQVLQAGGVTGEQVVILVSGLVGPKFGAETFGSLCPNASYHYYGERDVVFARAEIYQPHGVAIVAATGATAFGMRADDGREIMLGGWGALLGDEGSAYQMGYLGLRAAVMAYEERAPLKTRLVKALCEHFGLQQETFHEVMIELAYRKPLSRAEIASVACLVTRLAREGDPAAQQITTQVVIDLSNLMLHASRRLFMPREVFDVVIGGGMVNAGEMILGPLRSRLAAEFPQAALRVGSESPAVALGRLDLFNQSINGG